MEIREYRVHEQRERIKFDKGGRDWQSVAEFVLELDKFKKSNYKNTFADKGQILSALENQDATFLRNLSLYFMGISGIYQRIVRYMSSLLTYDWFAYPYLPDPKAKPKEIEEEMRKVLAFLDGSILKSALSHITETVVAEGAFYGYMVVNSRKDASAILELPIDYCKSRFKVNGMPAVEFNVKYFDDEFSDEELRKAVLNSFPEEFLKSYNLYKAGVIKLDPNDRGAWFVCDTKLAMKFSLTSNDTPLFSSVIPTIINLDEAKELDLRKTTQELLKILIQKMPLDRNGDLIFDIEESLDMHQTASRMLAGAPNLNVLTTFAEVEVADLDNATKNSTRDPLMKIERGIFNEAGLSQNLFATDGNLSLEKSISNDEAIMFNLLDSYQNRLNAILDFLFNKRGMIFKIGLPHISIYNREKKQKMYRDMATNGYSKILPAISSGMTQSEFLSLNTYEEKILKIGEKLVPVQSSNTQSSKGGDGQVGAPKKEEGELAEKTIQNRESMS